VEIQLKIPGTHHFNNALMAAAIGLYFDIPIESIKETLENFEPVSQRMQVYTVDGVLIINDAYNANPDSSRSAIEYLSQLSFIKGRKIIAFGDMLELGDFGEQEHYSLGEFISNQSIDMVFLFGPLAKMIEKGIAENNSFSGKTYWYETHQKITEHLKKIIAPNDALLIKGSRGMKMENILTNLFNQN
jgi:UDP-N-acetylmuramoyl-tripeptide--D-alanyl-D-alanine ligase